MTATDHRRLTLPLIFLVALNVVPGAWLRPFWSMIFASVLLGYRFWLHVIDAKMPPRWIMFIGQITVAVAIWQHYFTFFGDEAAGTFLALLMCLKLYELRAKRDYFIAILLCFLVLMSQLLLDQTLFMTVFLVVDLVLLMSFLFALEEGSWVWRRGWKANLKPAGILALKSVPLLVAVFVLFPRFSTGFGTAQNVSAKTGVTDSLRPGSVGNLIASDELVFRATFLDGVVPPRPSLYWRGAVLDQANDLNWDRSKNDIRGRPSYAPGEPDIEIFLEAGYERFLFTLDTTETISFPRESTRSVRRGGRVFELDNPLQTRQRYFLHSADKKIADDEDLGQYLEAGSKPSDEMRDFLKKIRGASDRETAAAITQHFQTRGFTYTLSPPPAATLDDFVFKTKAGFCEHFAGSMGTMLRYLGIPSRVVVGFQGGKPSILENYITVRAHDAHAWVEYFDRQSKRWTRVDPTVQVDPSRITEGSQAYLRVTQAWTSWFPGLEKARATVDEIDAAWTGFLLRFDLAKQKELLARLGMEEVLFRALPVFLMLAIVLILSVLYYIEAQRREPLSAEESMYRLFLRKLKRLKLEKLPHEGPLQLLQRIETERPELGAKVRPVLMHLIEFRYGKNRLDSKNRSRLKSQIRAI